MPSKRFVIGFLLGASVGFALTYPYFNSVRAQGPPQGPDIELGYFVTFGWIPIAAIAFIGALIAEKAKRN